MRHRNFSPNVTETKIFVSRLICYDAAFIDVNQANNRKVWKWNMIADRSMAVYAMLDPTQKPGSIDFGRIHLASPHTHARGMCAVLGMSECVFSSVHVRKWFVVMPLCQIKVRDITMVRPSQRGPRINGRFEAVDGQIEKQIDISIWIADICRQYGVEEKAKRAICCPDQSACWT
jgi:hypothetical protein